MAPIARNAMASTLLALAEIVQKSTGEILDIVSKSQPGESIEDLLSTHPDMARARTLALSAAAQLVANLKLPGASLFECANAFHISAAIRIACELCLVEIFREAYPAGLHMREISSKTGADEIVLGRALRLLAAHHIFEEVEPGVFTNSRISSVMDTGKPSESLLTSFRETPDMGDKYTDTNGIAALLEVTTDEMLKAAAYFPDVVLPNGDTPTEATAFEVAFPGEGTMWDFYATHPRHLKRLQMSMTGFSHAQQRHSNSKEFDWSALASDSLVVDVGGGNGSESFEIIKKAPHLRVIVQDLKATIKNATEPTWRGNEIQQALIQSGRVSLEAHDFFTKQPAHVADHAAIFFMRFITHDWATADCVRILRHLHTAAAGHTKLLLVERIVPYACPVPDAYAYQGSQSLEPPVPLLNNLGRANAEIYFADFTMATMMNGQERTIREFQEMTALAGWTIEEVYHSFGNLLSQIVCVKTQ